MSTHAAASMLGDGAALPPPGQLPEPAPFLAEIYRLAAAGEEEAAMDVVFDHVNALLMGGLFSRCDELLQSIDVRQLPPVLLISFLTITAAARDKLLKREQFHAQATAEIVHRRGPETAKRLLVGLE